LRQYQQQLLKIVVLYQPFSCFTRTVPGVTVTRNSAQAGREGWNFQIRGAASVNSTEPLVIVDGVPVPSVGALNSFNPNDIENISFLKDGSAAIYGSRAAGGVVLITTKRGKSGKVVIDYNGSTSIKKVGLLLS
jgi:TonB-dependent SusC/RagA subfamily outer membrane receptor